MAQMSTDMSIHYAKLFYVVKMVFSAINFYARRYCEKFRNFFIDEWMSDKNLAFEVIEISSLIEVIDSRSLDLKWNK